MDNVKLLRPPPGALPTERIECRDEADVLANVVETLDWAISCLPPASSWRWAFLTIRRHAADCAGLPLARPVRSRARG